MGQKIHTNAETAFMCVTLNIVHNFDVQIVMPRIKFRLVFTGSIKIYTLTDWLRIID